MMVPPEILFQDDDILVVNKPAGLSLFPESTSPCSLWESLKTHWQGRTLYPVHRLDKETSGVLLLAFSKRAQAQLNRQFTQHTIEKVYLAICLGQPDPPDGLIDLPLCPGRKNRFRVAGPREAIGVDTASVVPTWKLGSSPQTPPLQQKAHPSQTYYQTVLSDSRYAFLILRPVTGRTHQIRVHLSWIGHQLLGDPLYGKPRSSEQQAERLALHSFQLRCTQNWRAGEQPRPFLFQAPLPPFFEEFLAQRKQFDRSQLVDPQKHIESILAGKTR